MRFHREKLRSLTDVHEEFNADILKLPFVIISDELTIQTRGCTRSKYLRHPVNLKNF